MKLLDEDDDKQTVSDQVNDEIAEQDMSLTL